MEVLLAWMWSDEIARTLVSSGQITEPEASTMIARPIAIRLFVDEDDGSSGGEDDDESLRNAA